MGAFAMEDMASLIGHTHGRLLRLLSNRTGVHFQGFLQAARCSAYRTFPSKVKKKLISIDIAFPIVRHITTVSVEEFVEAVEGLCGPQTDEFSTSSEPEMHGTFFSTDFIA